jgi:predicted flap endonuclease-1-like 5' DNA nuclease
MVRAIGSILACTVSLLLAGAGLALLVWLLWRLWGPRAEEPAPTAPEEPEVEVKPPAIELGLEAPPKEVEPGAVAPIPPEAGVEPPALAAAAFEEHMQAVRAPATEIEVGAPAAAIPPTSGKPDDLTLIEGIGPKISGALQAAGVTTFADLAAADEGRLRQILEAADPRLLRLANPATWPGQASLAAAGDWDALKALQDRLSGGR